MDWNWYLFSFKGRINRVNYWLAGLVIAAFMLLFTALAVGAGIASSSATVSFGFDLDDIFSVLDPATWRALSLAELPMLLVKVPGTVLFLWIFVATTIKRLHDRDKSGWWMVPFFAVPGLYNHYADLLPDSWLVTIPALITFLLMIWGCIELYFLRGTRWTNRFGANPLGKEQTRARSAQARLHATTPWDPRSEIEMVPHKANAHFPKFALSRGDYLSRTSESDGH